MDKDETKDSVELIRLPDGRLVDAQGQEVRINPQRNEDALQETPPTES
ncbi:MAG TPA: hypothetical protein P5305_01205 [Rubrivivax sp.]|nr:hypothetical protein [Rubrivivax sp.]